MLWNIAVECTVLLLCGPLRNARCRFVSADLDHVHGLNDSGSEHARHATQDEGLSVVPRSLLPRLDGHSQRLRSSDSRHNAS